MPIESRKSLATCSGVCSVEEAETLLGWLQDHPKGKLSLKSCEHLHTAVLQVLIAAGRPLKHLPDDAFLRTRVATLLTGTGPGEPKEAPGADD